MQLCKQGAKHCEPDLFCCVSRLQRPNVYLPVHLYGQLVHDKTGCHLLEAQVSSAQPCFQVLVINPLGCTVDLSLLLFMCVQNVVPDLSYTVRSPMLDTWEGIKQLKAALWALVSHALCHLS